MSTAATRLTSASGLEPLPRPTARPGRRRRRGTTRSARAGTSRHGAVPPTPPNGRGPAWAIGHRRVALRRVRGVRGGELVGIDGGARRPAHRPPASRRETLRRRAPGRRARTVSASAFRRASTARSSRRPVRRRVAHDDLEVGRGLATEPLAHRDDVGGDAPAHALRGYATVVRLAISSGVGRRRRRRGRSRTASRPGGRARTAHGRSARPRHRRGDARCRARAICVCALSTSRRSCALGDLLALIEVRARGVHEREQEPDECERAHDPDDQASPATDTRGRRAAAARLAPMIARRGGSRRLRVARCGRSRGRARRGDLVGRARRARVPDRRGAIRGRSGRSRRRRSAMVGSIARRRATRRRPGLPSSPASAAPPR